MARTTESNVIITQLVEAAIRGAFAGKTLFAGSPLLQAGIVKMSGTMPESGPEVIGKTIQVPYFGNIGEFTPNMTDGDAVVAQAIGMTDETATITRSSIATEATRWSKSVAGGGDTYDELGLQIGQAVVREMDRQVMVKACAAGGLVKDVYSASSPVKLDYDLMVEALDLLGDEADATSVLAVHSRVYAGLLKQRDAVGHPLLKENMVDGQPIATFMGKRVVTSDRIPLTGSTMDAITSAGTSPPTITVSGTPNMAIRLKVIATVGGALGTWKLKFSTDGGQNYSAEITSAASVPLTDTAVDSLVGVNGATGLTLSIASGNASTDNVWTSTAQLKVRSLLLAPGALAFWYNQQALAPQTDRDILRDTQVNAVHLYAAAHRYRRRMGSTKPGVVQIIHNAPVFA